eukprot:TRINITY_DN6597_c0_g1_i1.p1 TRINITY_DN6597_c0_g1~~TRINITY_DN6597_c0_g1_i1.p1  ORF type:complete len:311 (-),score=49.49 TRINITY_DN6597_c0_g1_i1:327-1232(-)
MEKTAEKHVVPAGHKDREKWERKGYLMQWTRVNKDFPIPPNHNPTRIITEKELLQHNTIGDCWTAVRGIVYDISDYIYYHPGGAEHLMRGAGRDCTDLFDEYHAWVSAEAYMAIGQRVGRLESKIGGGRVGTLQTLGAKGGGKIEFFSGTLEKEERYNYNSSIFTFKLDKPMKLDLGQHVKMSSAKGKPIMRAYTPINEVGIAEELVILIKLYGDGAMSQALTKLEFGNQIKFKDGAMSQALTKLEFGNQIKFKVGKKPIPTRQSCKAHRLDRRWNWNSPNFPNHPNCFANFRHLVNLTLL